MSDGRTRRAFLQGAGRVAVSAAGLVLAAGCGAGSGPASPTKGVYRIGVLWSPEGGIPPEFRQRLAELGYVEGRNLAIEERYGRTQEELQGLAAELVRLEVDVIYAGPRPAVGAAAAATDRIPIVMGGNFPAPIEAGLIESLARPGKNVTGVANAPPETHLKRLELLVDAVPGVARVAVWGEMPEPSPEQWAAVARALKVQLEPLPLRRDATADAMRVAFEHAVGDGVDALLRTFLSPPPVEQRVIGELVARSRLPAMFDSRSFVEGGGLMAYVARLTDRARRAADYVDKILRGASPADLPVEQPTGYNLVLNLSAAADLGITIPEGALAQATEVIR